MSLETWTLEKIKRGFDKFYEIHNRYPTAYDVDDFDFLPSSRQIQRKFGGLVNLRKMLGLKVENYGQGKERTKIALRVNKKGKDCEKIILNLLKRNFNEKFIHIERPINSDYKNRCDFYIYAKPDNFIVDVFNASNFRVLVNVMNIKEKSYGKGDIKENIYFVYFGEIEKAKICQWLLNKRNKFPIHWNIISFGEFREEITKYAAYEAH